MALLIRYLNPDGSLTWYRGYDTHSECRESQGYVVLKVAYLGDAYSFGRSYLVEGDGRSYGGLYLTDVYAEALEHLDDFLVVRLYFLHIYVRFAVVGILVQKVKTWIAIPCEWLERIYWSVNVVAWGVDIAVGLIFFAYFNSQIICGLSSVSSIAFGTLGWLARCGVGVWLCRSSSQVGQVNHRGYIRICFILVFIFVFIVVW